MFYQDFDADADEDDAADEVELEVHLAAHTCAEADAECREEEDKEVRYGIDQRYARYRVFSYARDHYRIHHPDGHGKKRLDKQWAYQIEEVSVVKDQGCLLHAANLGQSYSFVYTCLSLALSTR